MTSSESWFPCQTRKPSRRAQPNAEHVYSIGKDGAVIAHNVTRKTAKTIWYDLPGRWRWTREWMDTTLPDGTMGSQLRYTGERELEPA